MQPLKLLLLTCFYLSLPKAHAISLSFDFGVNAGSSSIYACNAGIKHEATANVCYNRVTNATCSPGCAAGNMSQCTADTTPANCVCTGEVASGGTYGTMYLDVLDAKTAGWTDNNVPAGAITSYKLSPDGSPEFQQIVPGTFPVAAAYGRQITSLDFNLGSEMQNAEYFVDICYRGPQVDYSDAPFVNYALNAKTTLFDVKLADGQSYRTLSKLQVKAEARCIMNDAFDYCLADVLPGGTSACGTTYTTVHNFSRVSNGGAFTDISANSININHLIAVPSMATNRQRAPRFCQVRYTFKETSNALRRWKSHRSKVSTYTEITEPPL